MGQPPVYPLDRGWAVPEAVRLERYPALAAAWERSRLLLARARACLADLPRRAPEVVAVAASGSLGRMEAGPHSDGDLIVVVADDVPPGAARGAALAAVWDALAPVGLPPPKRTGIFATATTRAELCDPASIGRVADDVATFGKHFQLLLDTQPVHGAEAYTALVRNLIERYATGFVAPDPGKEWVYLLNDLVRYFRSLCLESQWDFAPRGGGWYVRSLKLRHSRVVIYAGLLFLLGECSKEKCDKVGWLAARLGRTPLERLAGVYAANGDAHFGRVATAYERYLARMADPVVRAELAAAAPAGWDALAGPQPPAYAELHANSRALIGELLRFLLARRDAWGERFFEYLLF
jgi:hypothetical protein